MRIDDIIARLLAERSQIDQAIAVLEKLREHKAAYPDRPKSNRGRKSMAPAERAEVSARMKRFWAKQKEAEAKAKGAV